MKKILIGFWVGVGITAAIAAGVTRAQENAKAVCTVNVGPGQLTAGTQCFGNKVQVGVSGTYLLCASLTASCPN